MVLRSGMFCKAVICFSIFLICLSLILLSLGPDKNECRFLPYTIVSLLYTTPESAGKRVNKLVSQYWKSNEFQDSFISHLNLNCLTKGPSALNLVQASVS